MLIKDYYTVTGSNRLDDGSVVFEVDLNADCKVYEGHFPGEPISPGVCNIQMIKECAESVCGRPLMLSNVHLCRFISLVTPKDVPHVQVKVSLQKAQDSLWELNASIFTSEREYMSIKAGLND